MINSLPSLLSAGKDPFDGGARCTSKVSPLVDDLAPEAVQKDQQKVYSAQRRRGVRPGCSHKIESWATRERKLGASRRMFLRWRVRSTRMPILVPQLDSLEDSQQNHKI